MTNQSTKACKAAEQVKDVVQSMQLQVAYHFPCPIYLIERPDFLAHVPLQPYPSWVLNNTTAQWEAPVPMPDNGDRYTWDENTLNWVQLETA